MFKDKELRKLLNDIKVINCSEDGAHFELERLQESGITDAYVKRIDLQKERIDKLEAKVNALMELLAVKEIQPETERKLKKGNKEVVIGKKPVKQDKEVTVVDVFSPASRQTLAEMARRQSLYSPLNLRSYL